MKAIAGALSAWRQFWFEPVSVRPICLFRILFGIFLAVNLLGHYLPYYRLFFSVDAVYPTAPLFFFKYGSNQVFDLLLLLPPEDSFRLGFIYMGVAASIFMAVGLFTRVSTIVAFACLLSLNNHFPLMLNAGDNYARLCLLFLCFAPCDRAFSLDNLLFRKEPPEQFFEPWPQRLIQIQFAFIFFINWIYKVCGDIWTDGSAVYYATRLTEFYRLPMPVFLDSAFGCKLATWSTLWIEFLLFTFIWPKKTRNYVVVAGVLFQLGLDWCFNLGMFEYFFIATYLLFADPATIESILASVSRKRAPEAVANE
ncbi:MAG: HTTM domain-containing protein [Candidatus Melainabacteria bacterium]|nr:HTTM domain-containing protein [Candidatus Melainabacteria bacterium]